MSVLHRYEVTDTNGKRHTVALADCLNVQRTPAWRKRLLERTFHRLQDDGADIQVEKSFVYLDLPRGQLFLVHPPRERYRYQQSSAQLDRMIGVLPPAMRDNAHQLRVVFGTEELREKVIAADAGLDDRAVELMKAAVLHDHPVLLKRARLRLSLDQVDAQGARFLAQYDHSPQAFHATYLTPEILCHQEKSLQAWSGSMKRHDLYKLGQRGDHWVNYRRWLPSQDAVADLHRVALALAKGKPPAVADKEFKSMLLRLPRGSQLSSQGKLDLRTLFEWVKKKGLQKLQDQLFEIRFGIELEDSWYTNQDKNDIDTLWRLLKNLPPSHVEGNSKLAEIDLGSGGGGTYSPGSHEIEIGAAELSHKESFEDTLRHEVGHAVHEGHPDLVNGWLWQRFGWAEFPVHQAGIDDWIAQMGPATGYAAMSATQKQQVRATIRQAVGPGEKWGPTVTPVVPRGTPWQAGFGPYEAFVRTGDDWYANSSHWYRAGSKAFAFNFWYATLMCVDITTLELINDKMPDEYAAMSPAEFFAELYALYYDLDDPKRKNIPADAMSWLKTNIGAAAPSRPRHPASAFPQARSLRPRAAKTAAGPRAAAAPLKLARATPHRPTTRR